MLIKQISDPYPENRHLFSQNDEIYVIQFDHKDQALFTCRVYPQDILLLFEPLSDQNLQIHRAMMMVTEHLMRKYHPQRIHAYSDHAIMKQIFPANRYYIKGNHWLRVSEPYRFILDDSVFDEEGLIINQGKMEQIPFGWFNTKDKGCGWIAAFNLLKIAGKEKTMQEIIEGLDQMAVLGQVAGQSALLLYLWLKDEIPELRFSFPSDHRTISMMKQSRYGILLYNHPRGAHYVTYRRIGQHYEYYNAVYGLRHHSMSPEEFLKRYSIFHVSRTIYVK